MAKRVVFVTGNSNKLKEALSILGKVSGYQFESQEVDLDELQGPAETICKAKCRAAASVVGGPVLVEDTSLCFSALGDLPGPYIKWFLKNIGPEGLHKMLLGFEDKTAWAACLFAYTEGPGRDVHIFEGRTQGQIVSPRGSNNFGWDSCFQPEGHSQTYAEMSSELKNTISHRYRSLAKLKEFLQSASASRCDDRGEAPDHVR